MIHENKDRHKTVSCVETDPTLHCKNDFSKLQIKIIGVYLTRKYYFNLSAPKCHVYFTGMSLFLIVVLLFNFFIN